MFLLNWFHFLILKGGLLLDITRMSVSTFSFLTQLDSQPMECFPLTYDLNGLKSINNRHFNSRFFVKVFPVCSNLFVLLFLVTACLIVDDQPGMSADLLKATSAENLNSLE